MVPVGIARMTNFYLFRGLSVMISPSGGRKSLNFWQELRRRKVIRVGIVYAITAWLLVQIAAALFPMFDVPDWASRFVVIVLAIGFPIH